MPITRLVKGKIVVLDFDNTRLVNEDFITLPDSNLLIAEPLALATTGALTKSLLSKPTFDADWGADVNETDKFILDGDDFAGSSISAEGPIRVANKFNITSLPINAVVLRVGFSINVESTLNLLGSEDWIIGCYGTNGQQDPEADSFVDMLVRCIPGNSYVTGYADFDILKYHVFHDLGTQAITDVEAARVAGTIFSIAIKMTDDSEDAARSTHFSEHLELLPPRLIITFASNDLSATEQLTFSVAPEKANLIDASATFYDQDGFQFIKDNGSESAAGILAQEDTDITRNKGLNTRLRIQVDTTNLAPPSEQNTLQYKEVGDPDDEWRDIPLT